MNHPDNSLNRSLASLIAAGRDRALEDTQRRERAERRRRVDALVTENHRRRIQRARERADQSRAERERVQALELEATLAGRRQGARSRARIDAEHTRRLRELALAHEAERETLEAARDHRITRLRLFAAAVACAWLATVGVLVGDSDDAARVVELRAAASETAFALSPIPTIDAAESSAPSVVVTPRAAPPQRRPVVAPVERPVVPRPPTAVPVTRCDDTVRDPCCAFGEIVC